VKKLVYHIHANMVYVDFYYSMLFGMAKVPPEANLPNINGETEMFRLIWFQELCLWIPSDY